MGSTISRSMRLAMVVIAAISASAMPAQATALKVFETAAGAVCGQVDDGMPNCVAGESGQVIAQTIPEVFPGVMLPRTFSAILTEGKDGPPSDLITLVLSAPPFGAAGTFVTLSMTSDTEMPLQFVPFGAGKVEETGELQPITDFLQSFGLGALPAVAGFSVSAQSDIDIVEPSSAMMLSLGLLGLAFARHRLYLPR